MSPVATREDLLLCHLSDPIAVGLRISFLSFDIQPSHSQLVNISPKLSRVLYPEKWSSLLPFETDWPLTFQQRRASFIPHKARDVLIRIHARNIQVAPRLHIPDVSLLCASCPGSSEESLTHCFLECAAASPIIGSLARTLSSFFSIPVRHPAQLLFAFTGLPKDGFPFTLLSSIAFHRIWLNRCAARFERDHVPPRVLLGFILDDFSTACCRHFSTLRLLRTKKGKKTVESHMEALAPPPLLLFSPQGIPLLHPQFKHIWLFCEPFHPP